jgi:hypothetical protein
VGYAATILLLGALALSCSAQELRLVAPVDNATLQYSTDHFVVFFSPAVGGSGLEGLRLSITNTTGNTISIVWADCYFVLSDGTRSDAVTSDVPASFQLSPTQIPIRQTAELVAVPLGTVSHSEAGWTIGAIDLDEGDEFALYLSIDVAEADTAETHAFVFRAIDTPTETEALPSPRLPMWSALLAFGIGVLLGLLLAAP